MRGQNLNQRQGLRGLPKAKGAPLAMAHPMALSAALPEASCRRQSWQTVRRTFTSMKKAVSIYQLAISTCGFNKTAVLVLTYTKPSRRHRFILVCAVNSERDSRLVRSNTFLEYVFLGSAVHNRGQHKDTVALTPALAGQG